MGLLDARAPGMGVLGTVGGDGNGAIATAHSGSVCAQWVAGAFFGGGSMSPTITPREI